ncbi:hypothetical protein, partial [Moorena sp. SIO2C4]|uniref:hypothetical protein n=1 Tax=Moorena sp. SIO2C4 TaxID=2607824 RepID=UPI00257D2C36
WGRFFTLGSNMGRPRGRGKGKQRRNDDFERQTPHPTPGQPTPHPTPGHPTPHTPHPTAHVFVKNLPL